MDQRLVRLIEDVLGVIEGRRISTRTAERLTEEITGDGYLRNPDLLRRCWEAHATMMNRAQDIERCALELKRVAHELHRALDSPPDHNTKESTDCQANGEEPYKPQSCWNKGVVYQNEKITIYS